MKTSEMNKIFPFQDFQFFEFLKNGYPFDLKDNFLVKINYKGGLIKSGQIKIGDRVNRANRSNAFKKIIRQLAE
jgi:hypothetical protein